MESNDNIMYLCAVTAVFGATLFAWLVYNPSSMSIVWAILNFY